MCLVTYTLNAAQTQPFSFTWHTNDTLFGTPPPTGEPPYGQANVDYIPMGGMVTFAPGVTVQNVFVQDINPGTNAITIGVVMSNCNFGGAAFDCAMAFN